MDEPWIDDEFRALIPPPTADELTQLEANLIADGCRDPLVVWAGVLVDGHNRLAICKKRGLAYKTTERSFASRDHVKLWINEHQIGRRNLTNDQRAFCAADIQELRSKLAMSERAAKGTPAREAKRGTGTLEVQTVPQGKQPRTRSAVAKEVGVSERKMKQVRELKAADPELALAARGGQVKLAEAVRQVRRKALSKKTAALPAGKFRVIYADPPWQYNDSKVGVAGHEDGAAEGQYPTMATTAICELKVRDLAADDSVLLCWATFPLLTDALEVVRAWGFKYKTALVWDKVRPNMGNYHNASAELLLICTRGSGTPDESKRIDQVQVLERTGRHSEKPEHFRALIDSLWTDGPRVELFRRGKAPAGWKVWGNESISG